MSTEQISIFLMGNLPLRPPYLFSVEFLKSPLATKFTLQNQCRAVFWEFISAWWIILKNTHTHTHTHTRTHRMNAHIFTRPCACMYTCIYVLHNSQIHTRMCICVHIYMCIHVHMYDNSIILGSPHIHKAYFLSSLLLFKYEIIAWQWFYIRVYMSMCMTRLSESWNCHSYIDWIMKLLYIYMRGCTEQNCLFWTFLQKQLVIHMDMYTHIYFG